MQPQGSFGDGNPLKGRTEEWRKLRGREIAWWTSQSFIARIQKMLTPNLVSLSHFLDWSPTLLGYRVLLTVYNENNSLIVCGARLSRFSHSHCKITIIHLHNNTSIIEM